MSSKYRIAGHLCVLALASVSGTACASAGAHAAATVAPISVIDTRSPASSTPSPSTGSLGDGVCASSLTAAAVDVSSPPVGTSYARGAADAIAITRKTYSSLPATATFSAYAATLSAPNLRLPDPSTALGAGPLMHRTVWLVEVGDLDAPYGGAPVVGPQPTATPSPHFIHHLLDVVDDATGLEPFSFNCP